MSDTRPNSDYKVDPRHVSRALACQHLFNTFSPTHSNSSEDLFSIEDLKDIYEQSEYNQKTYDAIVAGVQKHQPQIDELIKELAPMWPLEQIALIDLIVLRIGIWEAFINDQTPQKVAIDEAIELAKEFSGETSAKFVNGVLGNLLSNTDLQAKLQN